MKRIYYSYRNKVVISPEIANGIDRPQTLIDGRSTKAAKVRELEANGIIQISSDLVWFEDLMKIIVDRLSAIIHGNTVRKLQGYDDNFFWSAAYTTSIHMMAHRCAELN